MAHKLSFDSKSFCHFDPVVTKYIIGAEYTREIYSKEKKTSDIMVMAAGKELVEKKEGVKDEEEEEREKEEEKEKKKEEEVEEEEEEGRRRKNDEVPISPSRHISNTLIFFY